MKTVKFTEEQYELVSKLLSKHYDEVGSRYCNDGDDDMRNAYGAIISMRLPKAEAGWKEYVKTYPDADWRAYSTKEEYFQDVYTIYPSDLKSRR